MTNSSYMRNIQLAITFALGALLTPPAIAQDMSLLLAESRPTPCLDAVAPLLVSEMVQNGTHSFLGEIGRIKSLSTGWAPGNNFYDRAFSIAYKALSSDEGLGNQLRNISSKAYLQLKFRRGTPAEQKYLLSFFSSAEGIIYWDYMLDGATCQGLFKGLSKRKITFTKDQSYLADIWHQILSVKGKNFEAAFSKLTQSQKANFDRGYKLETRLSKSEAPDEQDFQLSLVPEEQIKLAAVRSLLPVMSEVAPLVNEFEKDRH